MFRRTSHRWRPRGAMSGLALGVLVSLLALSGARGDVIHLKNGGKLEGQVLEKTSRSVRVKTRFGVQTFKPSEILRIEKKATKTEVYAERLAALERGDVDGRLELAGWCRKNSLIKEWKKLLQEVLDLDPMNEVANKAFGRVLFQGKWMTPEQKATEEQLQTEAKYRAKGLVKYQDRWVTKEERSKLEQGLILRDGKWLTEEEVKLAEGFVRYRNRWVKKSQLVAIKERDELTEATGIELDVVASERFSMFSVLDHSVAEDLVEQMEKACDQFYELFPMEDELWSGPLMAVILEEKEHYTSFVEYFGTKNDENPSWIRLNQKSHGFYHWSPPASVDLMEGRHEATLVSSKIHKVGHVLINLFHFNYNYIPAWLDEGFAVFFERAVLGEPQTFCIGSPTRAGERSYGGKKRGDYTEKWMTASSWRDFVRTDVRGGEDRPLKELIPLRLNDISAHELAKASFLVEYLIDDDPEQFEAFLKDFRDRYPKFEIPVNTAEKLRIHEAAFQKAFDKSIQELDDEWRRYVERRL